MPERRVNGGFEEPTLKLRSDSLHWIPIDDEVVVLDERRDLYLSTNETGTRLWSALSEGATMSDLAGLLMEEFGIDRDQALSDSQAFVDSLEEQGLLESS